MGSGELNWSEPSPELLSAYEATDYVVDASGMGSGKHVLNVGTQGANAAAALLRRVHARAAFIVTAWNPFSEPLRSEQNHARQRQLLAQVARKGYRWLPAAGVDRTGKWPPEESLCVLDPDAGFLHTVLVQFEQNAVVEVTAAGARLVLHPGLSGASPASCPPPSSQ